MQSPLLVVQGSPSPIEYRWAVLNTAGTWPEILRRYVLSRSIATMPYRLVSSKVSHAASVLASQTAHTLTPDQHLILLRSVCRSSASQQTLMPMWSELPIVALKLFLVMAQILIPQWLAGLQNGLILAAASCCC